MMSLVLVAGNLARSSASAPPNLIVHMGRLRLPRSGDCVACGRQAASRSFAQPGRTLAMTCMQNVRLVAETSLGRACRDQLMSRFLPPAFDPPSSMQPSAGATRGEGVGAGRLSSAAVDAAHDRLGPVD